MTKQNLSEKILRESEARLRGILESAVDGIITINEWGIIESCNPAAERIFGYPANEMIGQNVKILMPVLYREQHDDYIANYLKTGAKKIIGIGREVTGQRKDGTIFSMHLSVSEVQLGPRRLFTGIVRDLTEQKLLEKQVLQAERLATIGKMAAKVAHEIRNPLSSISLNAELLEDEIGSDDSIDKEEARTLLKSIISEVDRLTALTEEYLQFSRLPQVNPVQGSIVELLEEVLEFLHHDFNQKKIDAQFLAGKRIPDACFDRIQIRRVFLNVIRNAMEAMPKGGQLKIWTEEKNHQAVVHIADTGTGIPEETMTKIFDPFFTTKDFGTGLGLAIVQQIIDEHGGQISCHSTPGIGTTFSITLPLGKNE
jgi:PAS domain S-box-containing protein